MPVIRYPVISAVLCLIASMIIPLSADASLLIGNVTIIDGTGRAEQANRWVFIDADRIVAIRDHKISVPAGTTVLDGHGKFLIPGLMDVHIHLNENGDNSGGPGMVRVMENARRLLQGFLYCGVTTVYDAGNDDKFIFGVRADERAGRILSPRIFATGYAISRAHGYAQRISRGVDTYEQGVQALDALFVQKPDLVKFFLVTHGVGGSEVPGLDPALLHRLIMYSNEHGFRTTIHTMEAATTREAVEAGIDSFAHPGYFDEIDDKLARMIATKSLPVASNMIVNKTIFSVVEDPHFFDDPLYRAILTDADIAFFRDKEFQNYAVTLHNNTPGMETLVPWAHKVYEYGRVNVRKLYDAGAILALSSDRTFGAPIHQELELLVGLGIPPLQAIRIGTLNAAIYLHAEERMGSVEEGKLADLVLLNADPTIDIKNTRTISSVILGGKIIDRARLDLLPVNHQRVDR